MSISSRYRKYSSKDKCYILNWSYTIVRPHYKKMQIIQDIINWVEDKPKFWQVSIEKLIRNNQLTDSDLSNLKEICKAENGLSEFEYHNVDFDNLREYANNSSSTRNVTLTKILNVENINALTQTNFLEFIPKGLTVIYGDNGEFRHIIL